MSRQYVSLSDLLVSKNAWTVMELLRDKDDLSQQLEALERVFFKSAAAHDDSGAMFFIELIMSCSDDMELWRYVGMNKHGQCELPHDKPGESVINEAQHRARMMRASKARELFARVPSVKINKHEYVRDSEDGGSYQDVEYPTMPQTKEALLLEIANGWKESRDESEADEFFAFFLARAELEREYVSSDDKESFRVRVFRKATAAWLDIPRLAHILTKFGKQLGGDRDRRVMEAFTLNWAKRADSDVISSVFCIAEPLLQPHPKLNWLMGRTSPAAIQAVRAYATTAKQIDNMVLAMLEKTCALRNVDFTYASDLSLVDVLVTETARTQNDANASFERLRDQMREWLQANRGEIPCRVRFNYIGNDASSWKSDKFRVSRDVTI